MRDRFGTEAFFHFADNWHFSGAGRFAKPMASGESPGSLHAFESTAARQVIIFRLSPFAVPARWHQRTESTGDRRDESDERYFSRFLAGGKSRE
jgi:hypothetical protein